MMISYLKKRIQTKLHPKEESTTNALSRNGSISCDNFSQFTEESIRKGPLSDFVFKEKYGYPLEQSNFQLNLKQGLKNDLAVKYFTQIVQIKGFYNVYKLLRTLESLMITCDTNESDNNTDNNLGLECDMAEVWALAKEEESHNRLNIPESLHKELCTTGHVMTRAHVQPLYNAIVQILEVVWSEFLKSECYCKYQVEILTRDSVMLEDILCLPTGMSYFMEFLEEEHCHTVLEFWIAVTNFQRLLENSTNTLEESQNDAILIYDKYLSLQATTPLGFSNEVRYRTELAICDEAGPRPDCFASSLAVVRAFLRHQLKHFVASQHFDRFLSDITAAARKLSPCSSMSSVSTESASLMTSASGVTGGGSGSKPAGHGGHVRGLSFGRIDPLGRFETDVHPEPNRKESAISKVMKRLTAKESKEEEEMAWRVAEKIVRTVTSLTLGGEGDRRGEEGGSDEES
uniref:A-kinase anchor protein 10, mitochondrial n=1 Tax=Cacopsylla melanoneura TaxID=428564 RepID=A0A8D8LZB1_9HEMI